MVFSSQIFLFLFLPSFLIVYYIVPQKIRNYIALLASLVFYSWGAPKVVFHLLLFSYIDYVISNRFDKFGVQDNTKKKAYLLLSILINISMLCYFKYANFFISEINVVLSNLQLHDIQWKNIALPIGISFYTFQKMSYVIDVYKGKTPTANKFSDFLMYVTLFPQLIAGPIIRYQDVSDQIKRRKCSLEDFQNGMYRFAIGLGKKLLIADTLGVVSDKIFDVPAASLTMPIAWIGIFFYSFQIYFDFSGYSDMAIGLGRMIGFRYRENFNNPYISKNISEFWQRWHISLSLWMKEYLYIPLGGNRTSRNRTYVNLWIIFLISGLWHGANWTFILWGAYHGTFLTLDKLINKKFFNRAYKGFSMLATYVIVLFGWVIFRSPNIEYAAEYSMRMIGLNAHNVQPNILMLEEIISSRAIVTVILATAISFLPSITNFQFAYKRNYLKNAMFKDSCRTAAIIFLLILSFCSLCSNGFNSFIYFRF